jgi:hypothetical protein
MARENGMTTLTASIDASGPGLVLYRTMLASLPNSYRLVEGRADVVLVSASDPATAKRAVAGGARAVVLDQPGRLSLEEVIALEAQADQHDCIVVPASRYSPRLAAAPDLLDGADVDLVESTITSCDAPRSSLVEQLALVRQVLASVATIRVLHSSVSHYVVEATIAAHPQSLVVLNGLASPNGLEEVSLRAIGVDRHLAVRIDAGPFARPADINLFNGAGRRSPWPLHQHSHRLTLALLHTLLTTGEGYVSYPVLHLRLDVALAAALTD